MGLGDGSHFRLFGDCAATRATELSLTSRVIMDFVLALVNNFMHLMARQRAWAGLYAAGTR